MKTTTVIIRNLAARAGELSALGATRNAGVLFACAAATALAASSPAAAAMTASTTVAPAAASGLITTTALTAATANNGATAAPATIASTANPDATAAPADDTAARSAALRVLDRWKLGGPGGWDYLTLDARGKRLFISRADHVDVVDTATGAKLGTIADTPGVHGIALAEDLKRGFTSNGKSDSVTVFDLESLQVVKVAQVPAHNPDAILYEPAQKHVFTFNGRSKDVTVLDASTLDVVASFAVPDKPEFAVDDGAGKIFLNIESEAGQMVVIDSRKLAVQATWSLPGCASPSGLALDKVHRRLFSVCDASVMVVTNADSGKQVARLKIGDGPDAAAYDSQRGLVFSSNGEGTLSVLRQESSDRYSLAQTVKTQRGARTMALDPSSGRVYLVSAEFSPAPAPTAAQPHPRPVPTADSFSVLVVGTR